MGCRVRRIAIRNIFERCTQPVRPLNALVLFLSLAAAVTVSAEPSAPLPSATALTQLSSTLECNRCVGTLLPGKALPHPETKWGIISDLPESFGSYGVLYSTRESLPANGGAAELLKQRKEDGFTAIDGGFDLFHFHLVLPKSGLPSARIVVFVKNLGNEPVTLRPSQVIKSEGVIGAVHEFESTLGTRVLGQQFDHPILKVTIPPGEGRVVAYGKQFGNVPDGADSSRNVNCFGYTRATIEGNTSASLEVSAIAIPAADKRTMQSAAEKYQDVGAKSTDEVPMDRERQGCALGRAVGVYRNFIWKSDAVVMDVTKLTESGTSFPMCIPEIQSHGCEAARQTQPLVLHPGYTRADTIGNYMTENEVRITVTNPGGTPEAFDFGFGGEGADVGLAYQLSFTKEADPANPFESVAVKSLWAGPKQSARWKSLLTEPIVLEPGQMRTVNLRFLVCGNSSLPFMLGIKKAANK